MTKPKLLISGTVEKDLHPSLWSLPLRCAFLTRSQLLTGASCSNSVKAKMGPGAREESGLGSTASRSAGRHEDQPAGPKSGSVSPLCLDVTHEVALTSGSLITAEW